jgi:hypothetical protein
MAKTHQDQIRRLRGKIDQLWAIASQDACFEHVEAVAHLRFEIGKIFNELEEKTPPGKTLCEVFEAEALNSANDPKGSTPAPVQAPA